MNFVIKPNISSYECFKDFLAEYQIGDRDLIITTYMEIVKQALEALPNKPNIIDVNDFGRGEPNDQMVDAILDSISDAPYDRIFGIGGGTVLDIAKLFVFGTKYRCQEIFERGAQLERLKVLIAVPTTCGTGSEVTGISICEFIEKKTKLGLAIPALYPDEAVLIPELLEGLPYDPFAASAIDALVHAMESYTSPKATEFSKLFSKEAIQMILRGFRAMNGNEEKRREFLGDFLRASCYAGIAFSNAGCGAVHALSYPLGAALHIPHGKANYYVFLEVYRKYKELGVALGDLEGILKDVLETGSMDVWRALEKVLEQMLPLRKLNDFDVNYALVNEFASSVIQNQQRLLGNAPMALTADHIVQIYSKCL